MKPVVKIAKTAKVKNSKFDALEVQIEDNASITDVYIQAKKIKIMSGAVLTDCKIFSDGQVTLGKQSTIKERTIINAFKGVSIGDRTIIDRDVMIGGMQSNKSEIKIGNDSVVLYRSYLNTTRKISIGNNVGIGGYCLIFTHSSWQNVLDGNPYKFADVKINENVWLPWNVTVLPGIIIGNDVTVGSGSVITKNLSSRVFAAGVPAKIIQKKEIKRISIKEKNKIVLEILEDFIEYARDYLKLKISTYSNHTNHLIEYKKQKLVYSSNCQNLQKDLIVISFKIPTRIKRCHQWIELDSLTSKTDSEIANHFISFVKRYGIRILTIPRYYR